MNQQQSYLALDWVKEALDETLADARKIVTQAKTAQDLVALTPLLHQVSGTLHMTQLAEPLVLAETLEQLSHAIADGQIGLHVLPELTLGIDLLRDELTQMQRTKRGHSIAIYRMVNHFRPLLTRDPLKQREWLKPDLSLILESQWHADPLDRHNRLLLAQAMRFHLKNILDRRAIAADWQAIVRVADYMCQGAATLQQAALWHVVHTLYHEVAIAFAAGEHADLDVQYLLVRLERLLTHGLDDDTVLADSLLQLGQRRAVSTLEAKRLKQVFGLEAHFEAGMTPRLLDTVKHAIQSAAAVLLQSPATAQVSLQEAERLLNITGWTALADQVSAIVHDLKQSASSQHVQRVHQDLAQLELTLAETILVTSNSADVAPDMLDDARHAAVRESRAALEAVKDALSAYHVSRWDASKLAELPEHLSHVRGVFVILGLSRPADLLDHLADVVSRTLLTQGFEPNWRQVGLLAEAISAIEYYSDQLAGHYQDDRVLDQAELALSTFEQPLTTDAPEVAGGDKLYHDETPLAVLEAAKAEPVAVVSVAAVAISTASPATVAPALSAAAALIELPSDDFDQDDEIREIFIEEAGEVLENIHEYFPQWAADYADIAALKEFRRAFHTLKGSGRMVGARVVGELAWSIESMLNRILDQSVQPNDSMVNLIQQVIELVPTLVQDYADGRVASRDPRQLISVAQALTKGEVPEDISAVSAVAVESQVESPESELETVLLGDVSEVESSAEARTIEAVTVVPVAAALGIDLPPVPTDSFDQDEEICEIFIEEVEEVLEAIAEFFPQWSADFGNIAALKEFRRGFHTLKGSGRMVGARVMGELAWSIENMLNRVLDQTIQPDAEMVGLITDVLACVTPLVDDFKHARAPSIDTAPLMYCANERTAGRIVSMASLMQPVVADSTLSVASVVVAADLLEQATADAIPVTLLAEDREQDEIEQHDIEQDELDIEADAPDAFDDLAEALTHELAELPTEDASEFEIDPQLLEIFIAEAEGYLEDIQSFIQHYPEPAEVTDVLLRAVHTLRGSAGMSGVDSIYRMAMAMESECKRLMRDHQPMQPEHLDLLQQLLMHVQYHLDVVQQHSRSQPLRNEDHALIDRILSAERGLSSVEEAEDSNVVGLVAQLMALEIDDVLDAEWELENQLSSDQYADYIAAMATQSHSLVLATARMPVPTLHQLSMYLHQVYVALAMQPERRSDAQLVELLGNAHAALTRMFDAMAGSQKVPDEQDVLQKIANWIAENTSLVVAEPVIQAVPVSVAPVAAIIVTTPSIDAHNDPELLEIFLEEAEELVQEIDQQFSEWASDPVATAPLMVLQRNLHTLKGGARMARVESLGDFGHELETVYEQLVNGRLQASDELVRFMRHAQDRIAQQVDQLMQQGTSFYCPQELATLQQYLAGQPQALSDFFSTAAVGSSKPTSEAMADRSTEAVAAVAPIANVVATPAPAVVVPASAQPNTAPALRQMQVLAQAWDEGSAPDPEMLEIFLDEAAEIVDHTSTQLASWLANPAQKESLKELQRGLHTLKGGARMAGVESLGDLAHEMEFIYEDLALDKKPNPPLLGRLLAQSHDWLADSIAVLDRGEKPQYPQPLVDALRAFMKQPDSLVALPMMAMTEVPLQGGIQPSNLEALSSTETGHEPPPMQGLFANQSGQDQASNEMIRVSASLMENMINLSGESAINRARIEMDTTTLGTTVEEMGATVQRLVDQLRRMEGELESQILARHQGEMGKYEDFDPLEMDQYSALNQLSKSLSESASDLFDFKATLLEKVRDTEGLLLQQSRLQSELQEGLMKSRLVPFSRLVPRLQRIVRQTSTELGKPAELIVQNAEGELDRTVLERMIAPLEHMLRNAVDHGIETPEQRKAALKPPIGKIVLNVAREGGEIAITLQDDGRGINVEAVRSKAIERSLLAVDAVISDVEIMQFIFHAGLSTAQAVTQISGRGVGMDVVQSEIKLLGGNVSVDSTAGRGSMFSVRLPLTVSVTDALMVRVADRMFAVPLTQIDRIVRVSPTELAKLYRQEDPQYGFESNNYRLRYLGEFIQGNRVPTLDHQATTVPLLLIRQVGQLLAIQVDQLVGSRVEIVVKPVGQQLASVAAVSGATILGDGSVMIILDMVALARQAASNLRRDAATANTEKRKAQTTVMVVDDSVTVRKVTTRLLERQGYAVLTAKDGVDAIAKLEDVTPDIMLLDIEMPRMDGFEVATLVRHNPRIKNLPIIMITSRTGEKHRERAFQIGVNCYMGKPFQEQELLENIHELLGVLSE
ncbi:MAG: Hpt domain-containing protein [Moraxellaceae bacterium]